MLIVTDKVYNFNFVSPFNALDGIYLVQKIITYEEIVSDQINMVDYLYGKVGLSGEDYNTAQPTYVNDTFYKLEKKNVDEQEIIYVPSSLLDSYPNPNVAEYHKAMVMLDLGTFADTDELATLSSKLSEVISVDYGITTSPELASYKKVWMPVSDYETLEDTRESNKGTIENYYSKSKAQEELITELQAKIVALEAIIIEQAT